MDKYILKLSEAVKLKRPILAGILDEFGNMPLGEYASGFKMNRKNLNNSAVQDDSDFIDKSTEYIKKHYSSFFAEKLRERLLNRKDILTANHHGGSLCNVQIQGTLLYSLSENPKSVIPSFAFGGIPLNNVTYPRGISLIDRSRIPLFPDSKKNSLVSLVNAFGKNDIDKAFKKTGTLYDKELITEKELETVNEILSIYSNREVLECSKYSDQAVRINKKLWKRVFADSLNNEVPEIGCLEMEKIVSELLKNDFNTKNSLIYNLFFDQDIRNKLIFYLDGKYGCWDSDKLKKLLGCCSQNKEVNNRQRKYYMTGSGTSFFWGIDRKNRRFPLSLIECNKELKLAGVADSGERIELRFNAENLSAALYENKILPSLFTSFCAVAFARGYVCYGGYMQADYLTDMKKGVAASLNESKLNYLSGKILSVKTENYCTGPHYILKKQNNNRLSPAGTVDIFVKKGLNSSDINKVMNIPLNYAYFQSLPLIYPNVYRKNERDERLSGITFDYVAEELKDNFIIIED
ncbi:MAG: hypothetical protein K9L78_00580 [Victivallales bacterium]|nr:hypothetical protein [Victivallales bacterium]MCF7888591.1 hypothetical protein [Victivallales bacterium]